MNSWHEHITIDPDICHGKASVRGTRIMVRGHICYDPTHGWYAIDPVDAWFDTSGGSE